MGELLGLLEQGFGFVEFALGDETAGPGVESFNFLARIGMVNGRCVEI